MSAELVTTQGKALALTLTHDLVNEWLDHERANDAADTTLTAYRKGIDVFIDWLARVGLTAGVVTPQDVTAYKTDLKDRYSAQTVNLRLSAVRSFYRFAVTTGRMPYNPASEVKGAKRKKSRKHKRDVLANGEVNAVLATCDTATLEGLRDKAMLTLFSFCALRSIEVHRANVGDLRTRGDRLTLDLKGKGDVSGDNAEYVIIPLDSEPLFRAYIAQRCKLTDCDASEPLFVSLSRRSYGSRLSLRAIRQIVKERYKSAGVIGDLKTTHSLRHSAITNAIRHGATPMQVQSMARHQSFDTTLAYFHEVSRLDEPAEDLIRYNNGERKEQ